MNNLVIPPKRVREIAINVINGNTCYIGVSTAKIEYLLAEPTSEKEIKENEKLLAKVQAKPDDYLMIGELPMEDLLESMRNFADQLKDSKKAKELNNALNRKKPIRNFMQGIESDMEYALYWDSFSINWRAKWVADYIIEAHNY